MKHAFNNRSFSAAALLMMAAWPAHAQDGVVTKMNMVAAIRAHEYWTPERFKAARPLAVPRAPLGAGRGVGPAQFAGVPVSSDGMPPSERFEPGEQQLFSPGARPDVIPGSAPVGPAAVGALGAHFTSTRVFPLFTGPAARYSADRAYPYRAVGKLFFTVDGEPFLCSAAVLQRRVVATAGHCVHTGQSNGFHANFVFVPAYRDGMAPFGTWTWSSLVVTESWTKGGGVVPNAADYAMIGFRDQPLSPGAPLSRLGNVTGWLGWQTASLFPNHTSKLGYPCNLDDCEKMQNVMSSSLAVAESNNVEYGSDAREGSSGGPWVQNLARAPVGGGTGSNSAANRVVGVTSYVYNDAAEKAQGASNPDNRWIQLWKTICGQSGNCN